jgi:hypothetical protein
MTDIKKNHPSTFKEKVAIEAIREAETPGQLGSRFSIHPIQVGCWKKQALAAIHDFFATKPPKKHGSPPDGATTAELYQTIGQLKTENDWLKKKIGLLDS